ncbi:restriction endonuclease [Mesorhizobium sp. M0220]|uniref:restriction endonuclease n=1 Tax=unclassified Mesorhizobium TaxID=325217 RepID=UPI003334CF90
MPVFIGRDKEWEWLQKNSRAGAHRPIVVHGPAGIGKTALLHYFAASTRRYPPPRIWTLRDDPDEAYRQIRAGLSELRQTGSLLRDTPEDRDEGIPSILAIDNADAFSPATIMEVTKELLNSKRLEAIIFARRAPIERELTRGQLELKPLSDAEARELIRHGLHIDFPSDEMSEVLAAAKGVPAALVLLHQLTQGKGYGEIKQLIRGQLYGQERSLVVPDKRLIIAAKPRIISANEILIERLRKEPKGLYELDPRKFEEIIADLMEDMGYDVELTPRSNDGGKDILASTETKHGKMLCLVEAKRYSIDNPVEVGLVRQLYGTLCDFNATSAMLVTTSRFTRGASEFQERNQYRLSLKDYGNVVQWLSGYGSNRRSTL